MIFTSSLDILKLSGNQEKRIEKLSDVVAKIKLTLRDQLYPNTLPLTFQIIMRFKVIFCPKIVTWISNSELVSLRLTETSRNLFEMQNKCNFDVTDTNLWPVGRQTLIEPLSLKKSSFWKIIYFNIETYRLEFYFSKRKFASKLKINYSEIQMLWELLAVSKIRISGTDNSNVTTINLK